MATTIKVNGTTITLGNNAAKASVESYDFEDVYARAIESAVMVDVMNKAVESMAMMSTEAKSNKFVDGVKKVWAKIAEFFRNIVRSIQAFFMGTGLKMRAASLLKRLEKNGNKFAKGWEKQKIKMPLICTKAYKDKIAAEATKLASLAARVTPASDDNTDSNVNDAIEKAADNFPKQEEPKEVALSEAAKVFDNDTPEKLAASLKAISQGASKIIKAALDAKDRAAKNAAEAEKIGKHDSANTKAAKRKAYSAKVKIQKLELKYWITSINCQLKIASALIGGGEKIGKNDKLGSASL